MKYYHCMNEHCDQTFRANHAKICPCCGSGVLRHAMGYEIDRAKSEAKLLRWLPTASKPMSGLAG